LALAPRLLCGGWNASKEEPMKIGWMIVSCAIMTAACGGEAPVDQSGADALRGGGHCGNWVCSSNESCSSCPADCGPCSKVVVDMSAPPLDLAAARDLSSVPDLARPMDLATSPPAATNANQYYVSPTGSDANAGTQAAPWRTIGHAAASFVLGSGGAVVHVADGSYPTVDVTRGGTSPTVRVTFQCDSGIASAMVARGRCKITGTGAGVLIENNAGNMDFVGFDVGGNPDMAIAFDLITSGSYSGDNVSLVGNYVHDLGQNVADSLGIVGCPENGAIGGGRTGLHVLRNFIFNFGINPAPAGCNHAQGIYFGSLSPTNPALIYNNLVVKVPVGGITGSHGASGSPCNYVIANNTIISTKLGIIGASGDGSACPGGKPGLLTIANNAIFSAGSTSVWYVNEPDCTATTPTLYNHNVSDGLKPDYSGFGSYTGPIACDLIFPSPWIHQAGSSFFANYQPDGSGDYHLKAGSAGLAAGSTACVAGGVSPCVPTTDFDGKPRSSTAPSVGAFE
jgi:hypothetical protein